MMRLSLILITGREQPMIEWLLRALIEQRNDTDVIELVVIDALHGQRPIMTTEAQALMERLAEQRFSVRHTLPRPNIWQGKHRVTARDWFAASTARNTGIVFASHGYIAFIDDRSIPGPKWMETIRRGAQERQSVLAGTYDRIWPDDRGHRRTTADHRRALHPDGKLDCGGGWLYGCTLCLPLDWVLDVNGFEEGVDGLSGEDFILGLMLGNRGYRIDFVADLLVTIDREDITTRGTKYAVNDKGAPPNNKSAAALERFGKRERTEFTPDLRELRKLIACGDTFPVPDPNGDHRDWFDNAPIREMEPGMAPVTS